MEKRRSASHTALILLAAITLLLGGCSNLGGFSAGQTHRITITSDPAGAAVLADGVELGVTPLAFTPSDAFRSGFTGGSESGLLAFRFMGKLAVRKPGCKDYVTEVNDNLLADDIHVKLECDPNYRPPAPAPAPTPAPAAAPAAVITPQPATTPQQAADMPASAEQRLLRIETLHDKGLISDEEYRELRKRVLDTL